MSAEIGRKPHRKDRKDGYYVDKPEDLADIIGRLNDTKMANALRVNLPIDATNILAFLEKEKAEGRNVTLFSTLIASAVRLCAEMPKLNHFVKNHRLYMRKWISIGYIVAKGHGEDSERGITMMTFDPSLTLYEITDKIYSDADRIRKEDKAGTDKWVSKLSRYPGFVKGMLAWIVKKLDKRGWVPAGLIATDPCSSTIFVSNLGSIGAPAVYHYLIEWGTSSIFACLGKLRYELRMVDGVPKNVPVIDIALTIDDRIADGVYFSKALARWDEILTNPECLCKGLVKKEG